MALARPFFSNGTWPWHASKFLETWFHFAPKMLTIFFSLLVCSCTIFVERQRRRAVSRGDIALAELSLLRVKKATCSRFYNASLRDGRLVAQNNHRSYLSLESHRFRRKQAFLITQFAFRTTSRRLLAFWSCRKRVLPASCLLYVPR